MEAVIQHLLNFDHLHYSDQRWGLQNKILSSFRKNLITGIYMYIFNTGYKNYIYYKLKEREKIILKYR